MASKELQFISVNVVASAIIAFAVKSTTYFDPNTESPETMVINIAVDSAKIPTGVVDIPVYLPVSCYKSMAHFEMRDLFMRGDPFVPLRFDGLELRLSKNGNYYGIAQDFSVEKNPLAYLEEEDLL